MKKGLANIELDLYILETFIGYFFNLGEIAFNIASSLKSQ